MQDDDYDAKEFGQRPRANDSDGKFGGDEPDPGILLTLLNTHKKAWTKTTEEGKNTVGNMLTAHQAIDLIIQDVEEMINVRRALRKTSSRTIYGIKGCARCGGEHVAVIAMELELAMAPPDAPSLVWTHWFPCPTNGEPVMVAIDKCASSPV